MPRKARIDAPGALHHIIIRGIERKAIFKNDVDKDNFLERLGSILKETETPCYAWVLMSNHAHLLMKTGYVPIATIMRRLITVYAQQFNRKYNRHGQLFQNRYKSFLCEEEVYLKELVRYIHLNPVRAKMVKEMAGLKLYPYTGHSALMGKNKNEWQSVDYVLNLFEKNGKSARRNYALFVSKGIEDGKRPDLVGGGLIRSVGGWSALSLSKKEGVRIKGDERILGSSDFVKGVLKKANENLDEYTKLKSNAPDLDELIKRIASYYKIDLEELKTSTKNRLVSKARAMLSYMAVRKLRVSCADVARSLNIAPSAVSKAAVRGQINSERNKVQRVILGG
ncbi:MAG: transposase [Desulfobacterales bacterium]|nr:transposase [Desulfobacterales bacterium]